MDSFIKHAALIWQQDGCTVDQARFKAWCEGPDGYAERLKIEEAVSDQMGMAMGEIAEALKGAVDQYGADAVDLALMAFRLEAAHSLMLGFMQLIAALVVWKLLRWFYAVTKKGWDEADDGSQMARVFGTIGGVTIGLIFLAGGILRITSVSAWAAVFGYPELRVAIKALEAAGLM